MISKPQFPFRLKTQFDDLCAASRCTNPIDVVYLEIGLCDQHWEYFAIDTTDLTENDKSATLDLKGKRQMNFKKHPKPGICAAMRCCENAVHTLPGGLELCQTHWDQHNQTKKKHEPGTESVENALMPVGTDTEKKLAKEATELHDALDLVRGFEIVTTEDVAFAEESESCNYARSALSWAHATGSRSQTTRRTGPRHAPGDLSSSGALRSDRKSVV